MTDLLAIKELAFNGYGIQATTLASSSFETAFMIGCIGGDNIRGKKWIEHTNWQNPVYSVYKSVEMALRNDGWNKQNLKTKTDRIYDGYRELCAVKHGNSQVQQHFHITQQGKDWTLTLGPDPSENSLFLSATSLCQLMSFIVGAGDSFTRHHVPEASHIELSQIAEKLRKQLKEFDDHVKGKPIS